MDRSDQNVIPQLHSVSRSLCFPLPSGLARVNGRNATRAFKLTTFTPTFAFRLPFSDPPTSWRLVLSFSDEIVKLREYRAANPNAEPPKFEDPGFRALVEENVKNTVSRVAQGVVMTDVSGSILSLSRFHSAEPERFLGSSSFHYRSKISSTDIFPSFLPSLRNQHWQAFLTEQKNGGQKRAGEAVAPLKPVYVHGE